MLNFFFFFFEAFQENINIYILKAKSQTIYCCVVFSVSSILLKSKCKVEDHRCKVLLFLVVLLFLTLPTEFGVANYICSLICTGLGKSTKIFRILKFILISKLLIF